MANGAAGEAIEAARLSASTELSLARMDLADLPRQLCFLPALETLDCSDNRLERLPDWLFEMKRLRRLLLRNNQLRRVGPALAGLTALEVLELDGNPIEALPIDVLAALPLRRLTLPADRWRTETGDALEWIRWWAGAHADHLSVHRTLDDVVAMLPDIVADSLLHTFAQPPGPIAAVEARFEADRAEATRAFGDVLARRSRGAVAATARARRTSRRLCAKLPNDLAAARADAATARQAEMQRLVATMRSRRDALADLVAAAKSEAVEELKATEGDAKSVIRACRPLREKTSDLYKQIEAAPTTLAQQARTVGCQLHDDFQSRVDDIVAAAEGNNAAARSAFLDALAAARAAAHATLDKHRKTLLEAEEALSTRLRQTHTEVRRAMSARVREVATEQSRLRERSAALPAPEAELPVALAGHAVDVALSELPRRVHELGSDASVEIAARATLFDARFDAEVAAAFGRATAWRRRVDDEVARHTAGAQVRADAWRRVLERSSAELHAAQQATQQAATAAVAEHDEMWLRHAAATVRAFRAERPELRKDVCKADEAIYGQCQTCRNRDPNRAHALVWTALQQEFGRRQGTAPTSDEEKLTRGALQARRVQASVRSAFLIDGRAAVVLDQVGRARLVPTDTLPMVLARQFSRGEAEQATGREGTRSMSGSASVGHRQRDEPQSPPSEALNVYDGNPNARPRWRWGPTPPSCRLCGAPEA